MTTNDHPVDAALIAGTFSTALFVLSYLPMLVKAARTRDLDSYSRGQLVLATVGNVVNSVYVVSLPVGPVWFLHGFNLTCTVLMLAWHLRYVTGGAPPPVDVREAAPNAASTS
ncbi:putative membrane protein [Nocardioides cavernae]|uniref:Putative membrane protein n=1 Tax=Nocardioides cavernae TaxID=1921566 RepID=A0A7Y9H529_9ACTN|nr:hypothetical protein [Nocardioides cavernae]NYE38045.1 putative membrane protein [Nocardioides cavernae]